MGTNLHDLGYILFQNQSECYCTPLNTRPCKNDSAVAIPGVFAQALQIYSTFSNAPSVVQNLSKAKYCKSIKRNKKQSAPQQLERYIQHLVGFCVSCQLISSDI